MKYDPTQAKSLFYLPPGDYEASLVSCEEKTSKTNINMAVLTWRVYQPDGQPVLVKDWILLEGEFNGLWKLKKMAKAWGVLDQFESATFDPANFIDSNLMVKLKVKPADGKYSESNSVADYKPMVNTGQSSTVTVALRNQMKRAEAEQANDPVFAPDENHDDIPF